MISDRLIVSKVTTKVDFFWKNPSCGGLKLRNSVFDYRHTTCKKKPPGEISKS
jgi:hypothetical protein